MTKQTNKEAIKNLKKIIKILEDDNEEHQPSVIILQFLQETKDWRSDIHCH